MARPPHVPQPATELEEFFELSIDPVSIIAFDGEFKRVNASFVRLLGYTSPELFSRSALDILHPDDVERAREALAQLSEGNDAVRFEARVVCADGAVRWLEWSMRSMPERGVVYSVGRDMTERRRVEAELVEAQRLLEASRDELCVLAEEQAALRRVATLVERGTVPESVFRAVADEVGALIGCDTAAIVRFEADGWATVMGAHQARRRPGDRFEPDPGYVVASVRSTGHAARFDTDDPSAEDTPEAVRAEGIRSGLAVPIVVDGDLWGTITVASLQRSLGVGTERRLAEFAALLATAISNTQAREELHQLANTQGALRRVATLVASEASQAEVFSAIADECAALFGVEETRMFRFEAGPSEVVVAASGSSADIFPVGSRYPLGGENATTRVFRTGRPARVDDFPATATGPIGDAGRSTGIRSVVAAPVIVAGRLWGALTMGTYDDPPPAHTEQRVAEFTELMATAIANTESRATADWLAHEQAALRRVATLVAQEAPLEAVFAKVAEEAARTLGDVDSALWRDDGDGSVTAVAVRGPGDAPGVSLGTRLSLDGDSVTAEVLREGRPHRIDDYSRLAGSIAERARELGMRSAVGCPIVVGSRTWGVMTVATYGAEPFARETETRVARFSDLVATAIANAEARAEVERLAAEQAALRRVATLVAEEQSPAEVFAKVAEEAAKVLEKIECALLRDSGDDSATVVAAQGADMSARFPVGTQLPTEGEGVLASALREGWPQRIEYRSAGGATAQAARKVGISSAVASPIAAREGIWGAIVAARFDGGSCPPDTETRLAQFADLVATAIANANARAQVERLAEEQAALRRVAMLAAAGASPTAVLDAVAAEVEALLDADQVALTRFEPGDEILVLAHRGLGVERTPIGSRVSIAGESAPATVRRTGRPARMEDHDFAEGAIAEIARDTRLRSSVSAPISVEGGLWGLITASWQTEEPPPPDTEERMVKFAELLDTAIANADSRGQLTASRARLVTAGDEARRRVVRDLHDGAQQRLVHTIVTLKLAQRALRQEDKNAEALVGQALQHAEQSNVELRELAHGILPAALTRGGLRSGVNALVARLDLPVGVQVSSERVPAEIEASAYFLVAEALTNVIKHARAARAEVTASVEDGVLQVAIRDDGVGGADPTGHGLVGMADRVSALGGELSVDSPEDGGTLVSAMLPLSTDGAGPFSGQ